VPLRRRETSSQYERLSLVASVFPKSLEPQLGVAHRALDVLVSHVRLQ
jgi:hypothetical protein